MLHFRESNNQRLSPWGWPFSCFPDLVIDLCQNINHEDTPPAGTSSAGILSTPADFPFFSAAIAISTSS